MEAQLLTDKTRLQEIYELRVIAYQDSPYSKYVNKELYPQGYFDEFDTFETTNHWIIEVNQQIIASVRLTVIYDLKGMHEPLTTLNLPAERPFAYCGRTVVHPKFRHTKAVFQLDQVIKHFIVENKWINFGLCYVIPERIKAVKKLGFQEIGKIEYDWGNQDKLMLDAFIFKRENL